MTVRVFHPPGYVQERRYAANVVVRELLGLDLEVTVGSGSNWEIHVGGHCVSITDVFFRTSDSDWLTERSLPRSPLPRIGDVPVLYGEEPWERENGLGVDVFGSVFFLLTRYEEVVLTDRDEHGRFRADASVAVREGFLETPLAHEYAEMLWRALAVRLRGLVRPLRTHRVLPSHDVDQPFTNRRRTLRRASYAFVHGERDAVELLIGGVHANVYDTFEYLMASSERRGLRAAFYFLAGGRADYDADYTLEDARMRGLLTRIYERGHEIGLHPSYETYRDGDRLAEELEVLKRVCAEEGIEQEAFGGRQHYLRWEPATWALWDEVGLAYDSTLTYSTRPGFRCGACVDYPVFDLRTRRELALRERPLVFMDLPTIDNMGLDEREVTELLSRLRARCAAVDGNFTVLWHNNWLTTRWRRRLFEAALGDGAG